MNCSKWLSPLPLCNGGRKRPCTTPRQLTPPPVFSSQMRLPESRLPPSLLFEYPRDCSSSFINSSLSFDRFIIPAVAHKTSPHFLTIQSVVSNCANLWRVCWGHSPVAGSLLGLTPAMTEGGSLATPGGGTTPKTVCTYINRHG